MSTADDDHERRMLERYLLRSTAAEIFPGLWAEETWIPGIAMADTWIPAVGPVSWLAVFGFGDTASLEQLVATLDIPPPPGLSTQQRAIWAAAGRDPEQTWHDAFAVEHRAGGTPPAIDDPCVRLLASRTLDDLAWENADAPGRARELHTKVLAAVETLKEVRGATTAAREQAVPSTGSRWRVGTLGGLVDNYSRAAAASLMLHDVPTLIAELERYAEQFAAVAAIGNTFRPPAGLTHAFEPWSGPALRLDLLLRAWHAGKHLGEPNHYATLAALEWHGFEVAGDSLTRKKDNVRDVIRRRGGATLFSSSWQ